MNNEIGILKFLGVRRYDDMEGINRLEVNPLLVLVPDHLGHAAPVKQDVVNDGNDLLLEVGLLAHLVVKPTLGGYGQRGQLLAHRDEAGKDVVADGGIDEGWFQLFNSRVDQLNVQIGCGRPRLDLAAHAEITGLVKQTLPVLPGLALVEGFDNPDVVIVTACVFGVHFSRSLFSSN